MLKNVFIRIMLSNTTSSDLPRRLIDLVMRNFSETSHITVVIDLSKARIDCNADGTLRLLMLNLRKM